jgi:hypothetical protein
VQGRYGLLLGLVLACIVVLLVLPGDTLGVLVGVGLLAMTVVVATEVADLRSGLRRRVRLVVGAVLVASVVSLVAVTTGTVQATPVVTASGLLALLLGFGVPAIIVKDVVDRHEAITLQTVAAGLCVYLLLGLAFSFAHGLTDVIAPGSYSRGLDPPSSIYLSFVTLTTVGFGDVTPVGGVARAVTVLEAVIGQIYLVSVVALLVGNVGRHRRASTRDV